MALAKTPYGGIARAALVVVASLVASSHGFGFVRESETDRTVTGDLLVEYVERWDAEDHPVVFAEALAEVAGVRASQVAIGTVADEKRDRYIVVPYTISRLSADSAATVESTLKAVDDAVVEVAIVEAAAAHSVSELFKDVSVEDVMSVSVSAPAPAPAPGDSSGDSSGGSSGGSDPAPAPAPAPGPAKTSAGSCYDLAVHVVYCDISAAECTEKYGTNGFNYPTGYVGSSGCCHCEGGCDFSKETGSGCAIGSGRYG